MSHQSEHDCSLPELQQQVIEQWYAEWQSPKDTLGNLPHQQVIKPLVHLSGVVVRLFRPAKTSHRLNSNVDSEVSLHGRT